MGYGRTDRWVAGHCRRMYLLFNSAVIGAIFGWLLGEHVVAIEKSISRMSLSFESHATTATPHHAHVLKCGPHSWRTKLHGDLPQGRA